MEFDAIIIGAGAAGSYCAIHAAERGLKIALIERNSDIGSKIRVAGGGRCNITNLYTSPEKYISQNPKFCRSALALHTQWDFLAWFESRNLSYTEKHKGQLFCDQHSRGLISALADDLAKLDVTIITNAHVTSISTTKTLFTAHTNQGDLSAKHCVIACGGPSFAKLGATDDAIHFGKSLSLKNIAFRPALVPLIIPEIPTQLAGVTCEVVARAEIGPSFADSLLFTHKGLSGPAILQISSYWQNGEVIYIDFLPNISVDFLITAKTQKPAQTLSQFLKILFPKALADYFCNLFSDKPLQHFSDAALLTIGEELKNYAYTPTSSEGLKKAEVCTGGIDTKQLDPRTMMVKKIPNLYVIGEAADITGWLGGYNFQWAWSSAWCCAQALISDE